MPAPHTVLGDVLARGGYRVTQPRQAVWDAFRHDHEHLEPETILARARKRHAALGRATVYRALDMLTRLGIVRPLRSRGGRTHFMRIGRGHDHVVCSRCDRVSEVDAGELGRIAERIARTTGFLVESHLLEFYGVCARCRQAEVTA